MNSEKPSDPCPYCGHERRCHFAVNDGELTDGWCEADKCGCFVIFGNTPGFQESEGVH